eukprot:COSAG04_NODE_5969_length_1446_cov_1.485523_3_plen_98_part_01
MTTMHHTIMHPRARPLLLARPHAVYSPVWLVGFASLALGIKHTAGDGPYGRRRQASTTASKRASHTIDLRDGSQISAWAARGRLTASRRPEPKLLPVS